MPTPIAPTLSNLHSNMSLLILNKLLYSLFSYLFTFQYVSINIRQIYIEERGIKKFTFQYVSINIVLDFSSQGFTNLFTFQYVSINMTTGKEKI